MKTSPARLFRTWLLTLALVQLANQVRAVIFYSTGDPAYSTTAPSGNLAGSGWQYEGAWGSFLGTPIAPKFFITAEHVGGSVGDVFTFNGVSYTTTAVFDDPSSDLRIWRVCGAFPTFTQIYTNNDEQGGFVVIGRGTQRGIPVTTSTTNILGQVTVKTNGWQWGSYDGVARWGENVIAGTVNGDGLFGTGLGVLLQASFDATGGSNECHLSVGDSAGAVFMQDVNDGSKWKLAGINYGVDGPYNTTTNGPGFNAAIFDEGGLYKMDAGNWVLAPDLPTAQPGSFYSTRVSAHVNWINSVINGAASADLPILQSSANAAGPYDDEAGAAIDDTVRTITLPVPAVSSFYRLRGCDSFIIQSIHIQGGNLALTYQ